MQTNLDIKNGETGMKIISLFSGAGGLDLGLVRAGHAIVWANDNDHDAVETYRHNIGAHIVEADIATIDMATIPDADVVIGGFPCQGFSTANQHRCAGDARNQLYKFFLSAIHHKQPEFFIAENVKGILSLEKGNVLEMIIQDFKQEGYLLDTHLINMADYGVPQMRKRVIFIGQRKDVAPQMLFRIPPPTHSKNGKPKPWVSIQEAIHHFPDPDKPNAILNHTYSAYKLAYRNYTGHRPTSPDKPSPTILARGNGGGGVCAIPHYNGKRRLTIRESATLQTFPESFFFHGAMNACYRQIGNAVPVQFGEILGRELMRLKRELAQ